MHDEKAAELYAEYRAREAQGILPPEPVADGVEPSEPE
jgi:hypothetical protein